LTKTSYYGPSTSCKKVALSSRLVCTPRTQRASLLLPCQSHIIMEGQGAPMLRQWCFTDVHEDMPVHFQIVQLRQQLYIWCGTGVPKLSNLHLATNSSSVRGATALPCLASAGGRLGLALDCRVCPGKLQGTATPVSALLRGSADSEISSLAARLGEGPRLVICSPAPPPQGGGGEEGGLTTALTIAVCSEADWLFRSGVRRLAK
jgi:hypothetical protein